MRFGFLILCLLAAPAFAAGRPPPKPPVIPPRLVARIDSLIATAAGGVINIQVKGAVSSGGWRAAKLRLAKASDPHTIVMEFIATPPAPNQAVIQGLLPASASASTRLRRDIFSVRVLSGSNEITSQILK